VEFGNGVPDEFLLRIPKQIEFRLVRPLNHTLPIDPMKRDGGRFNKISQFLVLAPKDFRFDAISVRSTAARLESGAPFCQAYRTRTIIP
jgi:hypothetical protein